MKTLQSVLKRIQELGSLKLAALIFVFLALFILIVEQPGSYESKAEKRARFFLPKLVVEEVSRVELQAPEGDTPFIFIRQNGGWVIENVMRFPIDEDKIQGLLEAVFDLKEQSIVSKNPEKQAQYRVTEDTGYHLQMWNRRNRQVADFFVGKPIGVDGQYFRKNHSKEVIEANMNLNLFLLYNLEDWKSLAILTVDPDSIKRITLTSPDKEVVISKSEKDWFMVKPIDKKLTASNLDPLFDQLKNLKAETFAGDQEKQLRIQNSDYKISVRLRDDTLKVAVIDELDGDGLYYAKNADQDDIYLIAPEVIEAVFALEL